MHGPAAFRTLNLNGERFKPSAEALTPWTSVSGVPTKGLLDVEVSCFPFRLTLNSCGHFFLCVRTERAPEDKSEPGT